MRSARITLALASLVAILVSSAYAQLPVRVGSKNFTEQFILGELYAQALEASGIKTEKKLNLGGTLIAHKALEEKQIDLYPEYTGTMLLAVLKQESMTDPKAGQSLSVASTFAAPRLAGGSGCPVWMMCVPL